MSFQKYSATLCNAVRNIPRLVIVKKGKDSYGNNKCSHNQDSCMVT